MGGADSDTIDYNSRSAPLSLTADDAGNDGASGEADNIRPDVEIIAGGTGNDTIAGAPAANTLYGGAGADTLYGGDGNDTMFGEAGNDFLDAQGGNDTIYGGDGNDILYADFGADNYWGQVGIDEVNYSGRTEPVSVSIGGAADDGSTNDGPAGARDNVHTDVENLVGGSSNDTLVGSSAANVLHGLGGIDTINGSGGADSYYGGDGNDSLFARDSVADTLLDGGLGTDSAQIDAALDTNRISIEQLLA